MSESPDWYDESKVTKATYADGYSGWVVDLGDGTCRFSNAPLLGEGGPEWGDRVDLFYNPCDPFERPRVGYRIYGEGEEPVGRQFGRKREPDEDEVAEHEEKERQREERELGSMNAHFEAMEARSKLRAAEDKATDELTRYMELKVFAQEQGVEIPDDLHEKKREPEEPMTEEKRRDLKLFLLAHAQVEFGDIEISEKEVKAEAERMAAENKIMRP